MTTPELDSLRGRIKRELVGQLVALGAPIFDLTCDVESGTFELTAIPSTLDDPSVQVVGPSVQRSVELDATRAEDEAYPGEIAAALAPGVTAELIAHAKGE